MSWNQVTACRVIQTDRTHPTGYIVNNILCNILGNLFWSYAAVCCYLLAVVAAACWGFVQHAPHSQVQAAGFALIGTTRTE
jgi:hypothetical protein